MFKVIIGTDSSTAGMVLDLSHLQIPTISIPSFFLYSILILQDSMHH